MNKLGIDVSRWQGNFDFSKAKSEGVTFAVLKGGGGDDGLYVDSKFAENYKNAKAVGLDVGCYWFSKALTTSEAKNEAEYFYNNILKGRKFELPIYIDVEHKAQLALGKTALTNIVKAWCTELENKGCFVGIYSSLSYFKTYMEDENLQCYAHWVAQWSKACTYTPKSCLGMWQFGGETNLIRSNKIAGVVCDQNYLLTDYKSIITQNGLNGYSNNKVNIVEEAKKGVQNKCGFSDSTMNYLSEYKWADDLFLKLWNAMK